MPERSLPPLPDGTIPYVPVPVPPDPARDARVAARRAADARRAGEALDRIMGAAGRLDPVYAAGYRNGFRDGYTESELHHNRNYGVPCALRRGVAPVDGCPCVNCSLARPGAA